MGEVPPFLFRAALPREPPAGASRGRLPWEAPGGRLLGEVPPFLFRAVLSAFRVYVCRAPKETDEKCVFTLRPWLWLLADGSWLMRDAWGLLGRADLGRRPHRNGVVGRVDDAVGPARACCGR